MLAKGRTLADQLDTELVAVILGKDLRAAAPCLIKGGADRVLAVQHPDLAEYAAEPYADVLVQLAKERQPVVWLFGATFVGRDLAPVVAVGLETGLSADCTELTIGATDFASKPAFRGMATIICPQPVPDGYGQTGSFPNPYLLTKPPGRGGMAGGRAGKSPLQTIGRQRYADQVRPWKKRNRWWQVPALMGKKAELLNQLAQALGAAGCYPPPLDGGFVAEDK